MKFDPPLVEARLIRRYKRFLADVTLADGSEITVSVPNTGSMMGLTEPGSRVFLSRSDDPKRKYAHRLEIVEADGTLVGINTGLPNRLTEEAIAAGMIGDLGSYETLRREQKYGQNSRIDLLLDDPVRGRAYVEVKNVHLRRAPGLAEFPDTRTARGAKHLRELGDMAEEGHRAIMVFLIQRADCESFRLCRDLDPDYAREFDRAIARGVEAFAVRCHISQAAIAPERLVAIDEAILRAA
ncbi:MAG: DNA/RNA nuclease SfsA [Oricola sp.]|nr:MAG: DNA/RNA nuclease SfsA [Oricola sp.]